jgi:hypothetical protein
MKQYHAGLLMGGVMAMLMVACNQSPARISQEQTLPAHAPSVCWFYQPVRGNLLGSVGVARALAIGGAKRVNQLAKQRAALGLSAYIGVPDLDAKTLDELITSESEAVELAGHKIRFVDATETQGYRYQYALLGDSSPSLDTLRQGCSRQCRPAQCQPAWLCDPMKPQQAGFIGVSFRASSLPAQFGIAVKNALAQLQYFYGVKVQTEGWYYRFKDSLGGYRIRVQEVKVEKNQHKQTEELRFLVTDACYSGEQLFVRVMTPDLPPVHHGIAKNWIKQPNQLGYQGAVGTASLTSDGLISTQIRIAIERAFGGLTGAEQTRLEDSMVLKQRNKARTVVWKLHTKSQSGDISGKLQGIIFEPQGSYKTRVYVWVVKTNE